jgi:hypothetical protein
MELIRDGGVGGTPRAANTATAGILGNYFRINYVTVGTCAGDTTLRGGCYQQWLDGVAMNLVSQCEVARPAPHCDGWQRSLLQAAVHPRRESSLQP